MVLVTYDVSTVETASQRRLRRVAKLCEDFGQRVQNSAFECLVDAAQWTRMKGLLVKEIDPEKDSLRFYFLGSSWRTHIEHVGTKAAYDPEGPLIL